MCFGRPWGSRGSMLLTPCAYLCSPYGHRCSSADCMSLFLTDHEFWGQLSEISFLEFSWNFSKFLFIFGANAQNFANVQGFLIFDACWNISGKPGLSWIDLQIAGNFLKVSREFFPCQNIPSQSNPFLRFLKIFSAWY